MHIVTSKWGIDLGARGTYPPGQYLCEDMNAADFLLFGNRGDTTMDHLAVNPKMFHVEQNWNGRKILIVRPGGYGDLLFLTPSLSEIKRRWPQSDVTVCAFPRFQSILKTSSADHIVSYPISLEDAQQYDAWVFLENVIEGNPDAETLHAIDVIAGRIGLAELECKEMSYSFLPDEVEWAMARYPRTQRLRVAVQLEASARCRNYPANLMTEAMILLAKEGFELFLLGEPGKLAIKSTPLVRNLMLENLPFRQSVAALATCDVVLGPDSVMIHLAGALGIPALGLYGPFPAALRTAYAPSIRTITGHCGCDRAPCFYHPTLRAPTFPFDGPCHRTGRCEVLASIQPQRIVSRIKKIATRRIAAEQLA